MEEKREMEMYHIRSSLKDGSGLKYVEESKWVFPLLMEFLKKGMPEIIIGWINVWITTGNIKEIAVDSMQFEDTLYTKEDFIACANISEVAQERIRSACFVSNEYDKLMAQKSIPDISSIRFDEKNKNRFAFQFKGINLDFYLKEIEQKVCLSTFYTTELDKNCAYCGAYAFIPIEEIFDKERQRELLSKTGYKVEKFV